MGHRDTENTEFLGFLKKSPKGGWVVPEERGVHPRGFFLRIKDSEIGVQ